MYSDFHFYIDFNWEDAVDKTLDIYLKELYQLVELAYQHKATVFYSQKYLQVKSKSDYCKIECENISDTKEIVKWIVMMKPRKFNASYHGNQGSGNWVTKSPLLCSTERAQQLLDESIPCFLEGIGKKRRIYNFDPNNNTFIEFFYEGDNPQNQWHGFHLDKDKWDKLPEYILKYYNKHLSCPTPSTNIASKSKN